MATLSTFLGDFFQGLLAPLKFILKWGTWIGTVIGGAIFFIIKFTFLGINAIYTQILGIGSLYTTAGSAVSSGSGLSDYADAFLIVNTFFPLDMVLAMFSVVIQLWIFWIVYRAIKSWIPALS